MRLAVSGRGCESSIWSGGVWRTSTSGLEEEYVGACRSEMYEYRCLLLHDLPGFLIMSADRFLVSLILDCNSEASEAVNEVTSIRVCLS